ncbi:hypothetical protein ACROYT_G023373 [Oculina patagonica]
MFQDRRAEKEEWSAEKERLLKENKELKTRVSELANQRASAVIGSDSSSSIGSNKVEEEEPPESSANSRQEDSSEEEFVDALTSSILD